MKWQVNIINPENRKTFCQGEKELLARVASGELVIGLPRETKSWLKGGFTQEELIFRGLVGVYNPNEG